MKSNILLMIMIVCCISCKSKLSENKVKQILDSELSSEDVISSRNIQIGYTSHLSKSDFQIYGPLVKAELINVEQDVALGLVGFNVSLTDKAKPYILATSEKKTGIFGGIQYFAKVKLYTYQYEGVEDIHENTSDNTATVHVKLKKVDKTPFAVLDKDTTSNIIRTLKFYRTNEDDWKLSR